MKDIVDFLASVFLAVLIGCGTMFALGFTILCTIRFLDALWELLC